MIEIISGFVSGIISGMGIGGGMVLIPSLVFFLGLSQQRAQGINLFYFLPTAAMALIIHLKNKNVEYKKCLWIILTGIPASILGSYLAIKTSPAILGKMFGGFLAIFGAKEVYDGFTNKK